MNRSGVNINDIKGTNRTLILKHICTSKGISRIELAKLTGLTKMTLTNITNELIGAGFICETDEPECETVSNSVGRRPISLTIAPDSPVAAGVWVSRDFCGGVLTDLKANILAQKKIPLSEEDDNASLLEKIVSCARHLCLQTERRILGIGICSLGPLNLAQGIILKPTNFHGIANVPVCETVSAELGIPAFLEKDMNASALAERYFGKGRAISNFIYLGITNGIGAGIISSGELFHGGSGFSGEFGHTSIDYGGIRCHCGNNGCIECYASIPGILGRSPRPAAELGDLIALAQSSDCAREYLADICAKLATALVNIANLLDPSAIIIGHEGYYFSDAMLRTIESALNQRILASGYKKIRVIRSAFGDSSPLVGAATVVMDSVFRNRLQVLG